jgi:hypothetical protein
MKQYAITTQRSGSKKQRDRGEFTAKNGPEALRQYAPSVPADHKGNTFTTRRGTVVTAKLVK